MSPPEIGGSFYIFGQELTTIPANGNSYTLKILGIKVNRNSSTFKHK
jgi:hypothetical protein